MHINKQNLGMVSGFGSLSLINGLDKMLGCKSLPLSHFCSIEDGVLRFCHVVLAEEALGDLICPIMNWRFRLSYNSLNLGRYNFFDEHIGLICLIK